MAAPRSLLEDLPFRLAAATLGFRRFNDRTLRAVGLGPQAPGLATVLHATEELGEGTVRALVEATHLPNGTLTGLLDTLERGGLVRRVPNPADGRSRLVALTPHGRQLCAKLRRRHQMVMELFREALPGAEAAELARLLDQLTARMRRFAAEPVRPTRRTARASRPHAAP